MEIYFKTTKLRKQLTTAKTMVATLGPKRAKLLQQRLSEIEASPNLHVLSPGFLDRGCIHSKETAGDKCPSIWTTPIGCSLFPVTTLSPSFLQAEPTFWQLPRS